MGKLGGQPELNMVLRMRAQGKQDELIVKINKVLQVVFIETVIRVFNKLQENNLI